MKRIYLSPPDAGPADRDALLAAFDSGWIAPVGPEIDAFERAMASFLAEGRGHRPGLGTDEVGPHCVALSSGTAALHLALVLAGVEAGSRVLVSDFTFAASANAVRYCGAEPVFVDASAANWNLDPDLLAEALAESSRAGRRPSAVVAVDLYGQCADYGKIRPLCREYGVPLIQDSAEALGARCRLDGTEEPAGLQGDLGVFSFNGNKILTTSGGGMLVAPDHGTAERARFLASQAREDAPHYEHRELGYNYRMSNLLAALGRSQLAGLPAKIAARRRHFAFYRDHLGDLPGIGWIPFGATGEPNYWLTCLLLDPENPATPGREEIRLALEKENIESRPLWKPMHLQPLYRDHPRYGGAVSERLFGTGLCLPSGSGLAEKDRARVASAIRRAWPRHP